MKQYIALVLAMVCIFGLVGCAGNSGGATSSEHKSFEFKNVSKLIIISVDGKRYEVADTDKVRQITENIESVRFEKGESSENTNGFGPFIQWYDTKDNLIASISVMGEQTIKYDGFFWTATDGKIDVAVINEILGNVSQTDIKENGYISAEEAETILREYLVSLNILKSDYVLEPPDPVLGEFEDGQIYRFEIRYDGGERLLAIYGVTIDGKEIYMYNLADGEWLQQSGNGDMDTNTESIYKAVLLGEAQFLYVFDGKTEAMDITDIPLIFDADDPSMKIWNFSVVDLDRDGEEEVILFVVGAAGDMGGKMILHQIGEEVFGYICDNRTLEELKTDGTFGFSDPTGVAEGGIATITDFSELGYTIDKISYGTGTHEGWNTFIVDHQPATEEEYFGAADMQSEKPDAEWYDFSNERVSAFLFP